MDDPSEAFQEAMDGLSGLEAPVGPAEPQKRSQSPEGPDLSAIKDPEVQMALRVLQSLPGPRMPQQLREMLEAMALMAYLKKKP